jgi:hypothetical protein
MNRGVFGAAVALCAAASVVGCNTSSGGSYTPATFCSSLIDTIAQRQNDCQGGPVDVLESLSGSSTFCADMAAAIAAGRTTFGSGAAGSCLNAISSATCETIGASGQTLPPACLSVFQGAVDAGGSCYSSLDCANEGFCSVPNTYPTPSCGGKCLATVPLGQPCKTGDVCAAGATCTGSPTVCTPPVVTPSPVVQKGGSCVTGSTGQTPTCEPTTVCDAVSKTCSAFVHEGSSCEPGTVSARATHRARARRRSA